MSTRRQFLQNAGAASLFSASGLASMLGSFNASAADTSGYKAMVCLFLWGGMDNYDTILPFDQTSYDAFAAIRQPLFDTYADIEADHSRLKDNLLKLNPANAAQFGSREFGMPAELSALHTLFENGNAAIVGNVGPLIEPTTETDVQNGLVPLPKKLFSHNDQQSTWMSLNPEGAQFGWGGLMMDAQITSNANVNEVFSAISVAGNVVFLSGLHTAPYQISTAGVPTIFALDSSQLSDIRDLSDESFEALRDHFGSVGGGWGNFFERDVGNINETSLDANDLLEAAFESAPTLSTTFPGSSIGQQLEGVATMIGLRNELQVNRQVFFVATGGFDTHSSQAATLPILQQNISDAIAAFYDATVELGVSLDVTLFTGSDFGRTLSINGDGTDHGWGGHHFVVGGAVNGGEIYGDIPPYEFDNGYDAGNGRLIPNVSVEQYAATIGAWFGLSDTELNSALPLLPNFSPTNLMFV